MTHGSYPRRLKLRPFRCYGAASMERCEQVRVPWHAYGGLVAAVFLLSCSFEMPPLFDEDAQSGDAGLDGDLDDPAVLAAELEAHDFGAVTVGEPCAIG
jgi:hypothetical protein